ncbi:titin-like [Lineus longissimus]|uniref:titin-like n=1 Tax=Lineus longissimus TaxID=88925 RepID=UPI00315D6AAB
MKILPIWALSILQFGGTLGLTVKNTFSNSRPRLGDTTTLMCNVAGGTASYVVWWKDKSHNRGTVHMTLNCFVDEDSVNDSKSRLTKSQCDENNFNFKLSNVQISDSGDWGCEADGREATTRLRLEVLVPPLTPTVTNPSPVIVGDTANLTCNAENVNVTKPVTYTWTKNGNTVSPGTSAPGILHFSSVTKEYAGKYVCDAKNDAGSKESSELDFVVYYAPDSLQLKTTTPPHNSKSENQTETFTCEAIGGIPVPLVKLIRLEGTTKEALILGNSRVLIFTRRMMRQDNQVEFYCEATGPGIPNRMMSMVITYNVFFPHNVQVKLSKTTVNENDSVWFECTAGGGNPELITRYQWLWKKSGATSEQVIQDTATSTQNGKFLEFVRIPYDKSGTFTCKVWNNGEMGQASTVLNVHYSPRIHPGYNMKYDVAGEIDKEASFKLFITANPIPPTTGYVWSKGGEILPNSSQEYEIISLKTSSSLTIKNVKTTDFTFYTCTVKTSGFPAKVFKLELLKVGPPSAPSNLKVVNSTAVAATLEWISEFDGGSEQRFYVQYKKPAEKWDVVSDVPEGGIIDPGSKQVVCHKVMDLESNVEYLFRVRSNNSHPGSHISNFSNIASGSTPEKPKTSIIGVSRTDNKVTVRWKHVTGKYNVIIIRYCQTGTENCMNHTVRNLTDNTATFSVSAEKRYYYHMMVEDGGDIVYRSVDIKDEDNTIIVVSGVVVGGLVGAVVVTITGVTLAIGLWKLRSVRLEKRQGHPPAIDTDDYDDTRIEFTPTENDSVRSYSNIGTENVTDTFNPERTADQLPVQQMDTGHHLPTPGVLRNTPASSDDELGSYDYMDSPTTLRHSAPRQNHVPVDQPDPMDLEDSTQYEISKKGQKSEGTYRMSNDLSIHTQGRPVPSATESESDQADRSKACGPTSDRSGDDVGHGKGSLYTHLYPVTAVIDNDGGQYLDFRQLNPEQLRPI